jgi:RNA polymerase-binding transcription factor DksA
MTKGGSRDPPFSMTDDLGRGSNASKDHATDPFEQSKSLALRQNLEGLLAQVEEALNR